MPDMDSLKSKRRRPTSRGGASHPWLTAAGWLLFALGLVGIFLPVLPTTVFWIGAVWCWSRSAPHLTRRILSHPRFGRPVLLFVEQGQMTRQGKWTALAGIAAGFALLHLLTQPPWYVSLSLGLLLALIALWLWQRPEPPILETIQDKPEYTAHSERSNEAEGQREGERARPLPQPPVRGGQNPLTDE
jgi:uncharacterized membrane protein YbaN (DUF454 family)